MSDGHIIDEGFFENVRSSFPTVGTNGIPSEACVRNVGMEIQRKTRDGLVPKDPKGNTVLPLSSLFVSPYVEESHILSRK